MTTIEQAKEAIALLRRGYEPMLDGGAKGEALTQLEAFISGEASRRQQAAAITAQKDRIAALRAEKQATRQRERYAAMHNTVVEAADEFGRLAVDHVVDQDARENGVGQVGANERELLAGEIAAAVLDVLVDPISHGILPPDERAERAYSAQQERLQG